MRKEEGCGLCAGPATCHVKTKPATETNTEEYGTGERIDATNDTGTMTDDNQNQQDTDIQTADILTPKNVCRVGCWIARTLYQTGRQAQVIKEMEKINIDMLGVCGLEVDPES